MPITSEWVRHAGQLAFLARPDRGAIPIPSVVVVQELWGVDAHVQDVTRRIAAAGYAALAPDLYARGGERPEAMAAERIGEVRTFLDAIPREAFRDPALRAAEVAKLPEPARSRVDEAQHALFAALARVDALVPALVTATRYLRESCPASRGEKVASVGFCMGGGLSAQLACHDPELAGAAVFYGSAPPAELVARIACPVIGFYGGLDQRINAGIPAFAEAMRTAGKSFEPHVYDGAPHAFFNDTRRSYDVRATRDSFARLLEFLRRVTSG